MKHLTLIATIAMIASGSQAFAQTDAVPKGVDPRNFDTSVSPRTDFYQYACGGWMKNNPLKPEFSRYGTFDELGELNRRRVRELAETLAASETRPGTNAQKIADLYRQGMDTVTLNAQGADAIREDLKRIADAPNKAALIEMVATVPGMGGLMGIGVGADMLDSDKNVVYFSTGGLGMGDRDYYIEDSDNVKAVREAYRKYLTRIAELAGYPADKAAAMADLAIKIETEVARNTLSREELRDPMASYHPTLLADAEAKYPNLLIGAQLDKLGLNGVKSVVLGPEKTNATVNALYGAMTLQNLKDLLALGYISSAASYLGKDFTDAEFAYTRVKSGAEEETPRWKRALSVPDGMLGEALGQLYVEKYFPASSKEKMLHLVGNLQEALGEHIDNLTWMSDETKAKAREKLAAFTVKIGYPDKWIDYSALTIDPSLPYWKNVQTAMKFNADLQLADYGKPVDRARWFMSPQTVNAYYNPGTNEICFPAAILQAPYFDPEAGDAENYGAIGVVIGHEMTHGFDDQGRQFDKDGNFANWWTPADAAAFEKLADGLANQFDQIIVLGDTHANGRFTLGENIADQGGLRVSHTAFLKALKDAGIDPASKIDGLTQDQRFYLAYANVWAGNIRDAEILSRTKSDPHSLGKWRVNASLRNIEPFFRAFGIREGDPMFRPASERVIIW